MPIDETNTPPVKLPEKPSAKRVPLAIAWGVVVAVGGGAACGWAIGTQFGVMAAISLWGLGALAGFVSRKITVHPCKGVGYGMVAAVVIALVIAEVCWIHWNLVEGQASWLAAVKLLPRFVQEATVDVFIAAVFTGFGAHSAFSQAGRKRRYVVIYDED